MTRHNLRNGLLFLLAIAVLLTLGLLSWAPGAEANPGHKTANLEGLQFQYWIAPEQDGSYTIFSDYAVNTTADIQIAKNALSRSGETFAKANSPFEAEIVFTRPLSIAEFEAFVQSTHIAPTDNTLRGIDSNGQIMELHAPPVWGKDSNGRLQIGKPVPGADPLDASALNRFTTGHNPIRVVGVVTTDVRLDANTYARVLKSPQVYVVDVMKQVLINAVHATYANSSNAKIDVVNPVLYAALERTGNAPKITP